MKNILVFSRDAAACSMMEDALKATSILRCADDISKAIDILKQKTPDLVIIDNDNEGINGIEAYKAMKGIWPRIKALMISKKADISLAVSASKAGVLEFLPKPLHADKLAQAVDSIYVSGMYRGNIVRPSCGGQWLEGSGQVVSDFLLKLSDAAFSDRDIVISGAPGISRRTVARMIHDNGLNKKRKFIDLMLSSFEKESSESMFWGSIQELLAQRPYDEISEKESCGTVFMDNFDLISDHFQESILKYLSGRDSSKTDRTIKVILAISAGKKAPEGYEVVDIPLLRERREDIPPIIDGYIKSACDKYGKNIKGTSTDVLDLFMSYDWPGNYAELKAVVSSAVLKCKGSYITIPDVPMDVSMLLAVTLKKTLLKGDWSLTSAAQNFEKKLIETVLDHCGKNLDDASRFLDLPKTQLTDNIKRLGISI